MSHRWTVKVVAETGSTNADLLDAIARGEDVERTALRADHQVAGRGRLDRTWSAPSGTNLLASLCFVDVPDSPVELTQAVGVAAIEAITRVLAEASGGELRQPVRLKWPNDVMFGDNKLAGVLAQRSPQGPVVVGIGLNVAWAPDGGACLAQDLDVDVEPSVVLEFLLEALDRYRALDEAERRARYVALLGTIGRKVRIERSVGDILIGVAEGVDVTGRLLVRDVETTHTVDVGDVVHLRTPENT